jgi:hypothetical protein
LAITAQNNACYIEAFSNDLTTRTWSPLYFTNGYAKNIYMSIVPNLNGETANIGIGKPNPTYILDVNGTSNFSGQVIATSFNSSSDYRLKTNIKKINDKYSVDVLNPIEYDIYDKHSMGFIAHEVQETFPFLVEGEKDGGILQSINYNGFIALLVKEIQSLKKRVNDLEKK